MSPNLLVINQHGDNRGDEAALRGMVTALRKRLPSSSICVLHQFASESSAVDLHDVTYLPLRLPPTEALRLLTWAISRRIGVRNSWPLGVTGRRIVDCYERADLVLSAPGGPYFGDLYARHEIIHWFYAWIATLFRKPLFLYQPSAGPFRHRVLNVVRRRGLRWFSELVVREDLSAKYVEGLIGERPHVGADSAMHEKFEAIDPSQFLTQITAGTDAGALVTGTFRDPGQRHRAAHDAAVVDALVRVCDTGRSVLLLPQLHGQRHADAPYLEQLAARSRARGAMVSVAPATLTSNEQRGLVAASDFVLAGRYHPLVFALSAGLPALVVPYEHKARGVAIAAGLAQYIVEIEDLHRGVLVDRLDDLIGDLDDVRAVLRQTTRDLVDAAESTADRVVELLASRNAGD